LISIRDALSEPFRECTQSDDLRRTVTDALHVLIVEDSPTDARLVVRQLQRTGRPIEFERVDTAEAMRAALDRKVWDAVTSDWSMPKFTAPAALDILKEMRLDLPFIIVSGTIGEESAIDAMRAGAHDFVLKDKLGRLAPAIERELRECQERAARSRAENALRESEERLRDALRAGDEFVTTASHELKSPLASLNLELESAQRLLGRDAAALSVEKMEAKLARVSFQVTRLTALINDFLDVTQITSRRMVLLPETFDLRKAVDTVLAGVRQLLARSGSLIHMRADAPVIGEWDRLRIQSVIGSLVANAIKYGEGKPIDVEVDVQADQARFAIIDRGVGISVQEQEHILRRFEKPVLRQHLGDLGLGLWVAREIIVAHGGTIAVASKPGAGSMFTVLLPLTREQEPPRMTAASRFLSKL
jgi:signal transduction histidine kinase